MIRQFLPPPLRRAAKTAAEMSLPIFETFTGFHTARGDYLPNRLRILLGSYERDELTAMKPFLRDARTIFDVGANVGYVSRFFARNADAQIFAFEPNPNIFALLERNVSRTGKVRACNFGLSNADAELPLFLAGDDHSVASFADNYSAAFAALQENGRIGSVTAKLVRGDEFCAREKIETIDVLKIDVEGWEVNVLEGLHETIARSPRLRIFCEYNPRAQQCAGRGPGDLLMLLLQHGFVLSVLERGALRELSRDAASAAAALAATAEYATLFATRG